MEAKYPVLVSDCTELSNTCETVAATEGSCTEKYWRDLNLAIL